MLQTTFFDHRSVLVLCVAAALAASGFACDSGESWRDPGPDQTFERFLLDWYQDNRREAFEAIDPEDRRRLLEPYERLEEQVDEDERPEKHEMLPAGRVDNPYDVAAIDPVESFDDKPDEGERVTLELEYHDGRDGEATMVWRDGRWYIDLPLGASDGAG